MKNKKNILFVCKHNRFRSKAAEVIFRKYNRKKNIFVKSAGTKADYLPVAENVQKALKELGFKKADRNPKKISDKLITWADLIVIAANDVNLKVKRRKIIKWKIPDTKQKNYPRIVEIIKIIEKRIKNLVSLL